MNAVGSKTKGERIRRETGGAVYVEFLIAFMPLFMTFMSIVQFGFLQIADIMTKHAAVTGVRAAVVVLPDDPANYSDAEPYRVVGQRKTDIETAVKIPLLVVSPLPLPTVTFPTSAGGSDDQTTPFAHDALVRVQVKFDYICAVPLGREIVCGLTGIKTLKAEAALPMQGANYVF
ncbi:MAG: TadE/TadG family type IV pilus assembly protein [Polyangiales bacterium]